MAVARALAARPEAVLADRPTSKLDTETVRGVPELMREPNGALRVAFVLATHDMRVLERIDCVPRLSDRRVVDDA